MKSLTKVICYLIIVVLPYLFIFHFFGNLYSFIYALIPSILLIRLEWGDKKYLWILAFNLFIVLTGFSPYLQELDDYLFSPFEVYILRTNYTSSEQNVLHFATLSPEGHLKELPGFVKDYTNSFVLMQGCKKEDKGDRGVRLFYFIRLPEDCRLLEKDILFPNPYSECKHSSCYLYKLYFKNERANKESLSQLNICGNFPEDFRPKESINFLPNKMFGLGEESCITTTDIKPTLKNEGLILGEWNVSTPAIDIQCKGIKCKICQIEIVPLAIEDSSSPIPVKYISFNNIGYKLPDIKTEVEVYTSDDCGNLIKIKEFFERGESYFCKDASGINYA